MAVADHRLESPDGLDLLVAADALVPHEPDDAAGGLGDLLVEGWEGRWGGARVGEVERFGASDPRGDVVDRSGAVSP